MDLDARAERLKFARLLRLDDEDLAFLEDLPAEATRPVRERVSDLLFAAGEGHFDRLVAASKLLPNPVTASIAQRVFPPLVCAQVAGTLQPKRAADLVRHIDVPFLASMASQTDPRAVAHIVPRLPHEVMIAGAKELNRRRDHLASGRLVGVAPPDVIPDLLAVIPDDGDLLEIAFYLERKDRLDGIVAHVPDERLRNILAIARERELWPQALALTSHLGPEQGARVATVTASGPPEILSSLLEAAQREQLWDDLLPLVANMRDEDLPAVASLPVLRRPEVLRSALDAAAAVDAWDAVVRTVAAMDADVQAELTEAMPELTDDERAALARAADEIGVRDQLGPVADRLD